jgi:hypothetical protein
MGSMNLDPEKIPPSARHLAPLAHRWAIGDDFHREAAVHRATSEDLRVLVAAVDSAGDDFWDWLAGDESFAQPPSDEYIAMTDVSLAADSARVTLSRYVR